MILAVLAIILLAAAQAADYFYQADLHGWVNPLWENKTRAPKWHWPVKVWKWSFTFSLDFIPHDGWHWAQSIRNFGDAVGVALCMLCVAEILYGGTCGLGYIAVSMWSRTFICLALSLAVRAALRGVFFSGVYRYLKGKPELGK